MSKLGKPPKGFKCSSCGDKYIEGKTEYQETIYGLCCIKCMNLVTQKMEGERMKKKQKKTKKTEIRRTGGSFDLAKAIRFKQKICNKPLIGGKQEDAWIRGMNFGFEQSLMLLENWLND